MKFSATTLCCLSALGATYYPQQSLAAQGYSPIYKGTDDIFSAYHYTSQPVWRAQMKLNGPGRLLWRTHHSPVTDENWSGDGYHVQIRDWDPNSPSDGVVLWQSEHHWGEGHGRSKELTGAFNGVYALWIDCFMLGSVFNPTCEGSVSYVVVDCGCPPDKPIKVKECKFDSMQNAASALCRDNQISQTLHVGKWSAVTTAPNVNFELSYGTTTTDKTAVTTARQNMVSAQIGAEYGFGSIQVTGSAAKETSETISTSISSTESKKITVECPDYTLSSTGEWTLWQWIMTHEPDSFGPGVDVNTAHFKCTEGKAQAPQCPLGFCADTLCQSCNAPFQDLGVQQPPTPTVQPSAAPTVQQPPAPVPGSGGKGASRRRMLQTGGTPIYPGDETYSTYLEACSDVDYEVSLYIDPEAHFVAYGCPTNNDSCPCGATHAVLSTDENTPHMKELLLWDDKEEADRAFSVEARYPLGAFKLSNMALAFEQAEVAASDNAVYDIVTNNCASYMINLASKMDISIDARMTAFVSRRLLENSSQQLASKIRSSLNYLSLFKKHVAGRNLRAKQVGDKELVELLVQDVLQ